MKRILVPTDFSDCADKALNFAVQSAKYFSVDINLLHSFEIKGNIYTDYMGVNKEFNQSMMNEVHAKLNALKDKIEKTEGVKVSVTLSTDQLTDAIVNESENHNAGLVVMGTSGAGGIKEKIWGSKTGDIIGKSKIPVMAIPAGYEWKKPQKILFSTNHFEKDKTILDFIFELAGLYLAQVKVVVFTDEDDDKAGIFLENSRRVPDYEKWLKLQYSDKSLDAENIYGLEFDKTIQDYIAKNEIDIMAMVTYQRNFWDRLFHPSMTKKMSYHIKIPLLAIPAKLN